MNTKEVESLISQLGQWKNFNSAALFLIKRLCEINLWPYGELWRPDNSDEHMVWTEFWSDDNDYFERFSKFSSMHKFAKGIGLIGTAWENKKLHFVEDITKTKTFLRSSVASDNGLNSAICFPILYDNHVCCLLCFFLKKISPDDITNAETFFSQSDSIGKFLVNL